MNVERVRERGIVFTFEEPFRVNVYLILGDERTYICDTACGPNHMRKMMKWLDENNQVIEEIVVFNSHADYDHIWGNCHFNAVMIGHSSCRDRIINEGPQDLQKYGGQAQGDIKLKPPNLVFEKSLKWKDDGVTFFHTPGHTVDSSSCYDEWNEVLFVGDNIETPLPYLNSLDFDTYLGVLERYENMQWQVLVTGHDEIQRDRFLLERNRGYLSNMTDWNVDISQLGEPDLKMHIHNLVQLVPKVMKGEVPKQCTEHYADVIRGMSMVDSFQVNEEILSRLQQVAESS